MGSPSETPTERREGISFVTPTLERHGEKIWDFLLRNHFPDEPVARSSGLFEPGSWTLYFLKSVFYDLYVEKCLKRPTSVIAVDDETGNIVGKNLLYSFQVALKLCLPSS